jgi:hypothetical protein
MERYLASVEGLEVDVYLAPEPELERAVRTGRGPYRDFILLACAEGRILVDLDAALQRIVNLAREIWRKGPPPLTATEQQRISFGLHKCAVSAGALARKPFLSDELQALAVMQCDRLFAVCLNRYCRVRLLWPAPIWILIHWTNAKYQELQDICRKYLAARNLPEKSAVLKELAGITHASLDLLRTSSGGQGDVSPAEEFGSVSG